VLTFTLVFPPWALVPVAKAAFNDETATRLPAATDDAYGFAVGDVDGANGPDIVVAIRGHALQADSESTTITIEDGDPPVAAMVAPSAGAAGGPPVYFDAGPATDDFGIVEYRWDFDDGVDRDGDGNFTNDIDAVGMRPFNVFTSTAGPAGPLLTEDFNGAALDSTVWEAAGATQSGGIASVTGVGGWGSRYLKSNENFGRERNSFRGKFRQSSGTSRIMVGVKNTTTNNSYTQMPHAIYFNNGSLQIYELGSSRGAVNNFSYARDNWYEWRIDPTATSADYYLREAGSMMFRSRASVRIR